LAGVLFPKGEVFSLFGGGDVDVEIWPDFDDFAAFRDFPTFLP
jgi:hypothetical protein